ncbi:MAG: protein-export chaperone SecB [Aquisalinus sp.]|nr:protein-export chaperone SecB [Aquisalinus sp.]
MSDTTPAPQGDQPQPGIFRVVNQYIKDLSFENPNAPLSAQSGAKPDISLEVNLGARGLGEDFPLGKDFYEAELSISATAKEKDSDTVIYVVETNYAGLFQIQNVPQQHIGGVLLVDCPTLLFPFARQVVADAVRNGGFTPLMLEPMDFAGMYRQKVAQEQAAAQNGTVPEVGNA